jgi:hypothetical protein
MGRFFPKRETDIGVKGDKFFVLFGITDGFFGEGGKMRGGHRERTTVEDFCFLDEMFFFLCPLEKHICSRLPIKRKTSLTVAVKMDKSQGCGSFARCGEALCGDSGGFEGMPKKLSKEIISHSSDEAHIFSHSSKGNSNISRSTSWVGFIVYPLRLGDRGHVNENLSQTYTIKHGDFLVG